MAAILITLFEEDGMLVDIDPGVSSTENGKTSRGLSDIGRFQLLRLSQEVCLPPGPGEGPEDSYFV
jgi:hypothetical protein